jgi:hypothetical protein
VGADDFGIFKIVLHRDWPFYIIIRLTIKSHEIAGQMIQRSSKVMDSIADYKGYIVGEQFLLSKYDAPKGGIICIRLYDQVVWRTAKEPFNFNAGFVYMVLSATNLQPWSVKRFHCRLSRRDVCSSFHEAEAHQASLARRQRLIRRKTPESHPGVPGRWQPPRLRLRH